MRSDKMTKTEQNKKKHLHDGHRARMRKRFLENGLHGFSEHEMLEMLLFYVHKRNDTNEIGHDLIDTFGSLKGVLDADYHDLLQVEQIGEQAAVLLKLLPQLFQAYQNGGETHRILRTDETRSAFFMHKLQNETDEVVLLAGLDEQQRLLHWMEIARGIPNQVEINLRQLVQAALQLQCASVLLAHNHPLGKAAPSYEDVRVTSTISRLLRDIGMDLQDHYIVADGKVISMKQCGSYSM